MSHRRSYRDAAEGGAKTARNPDEETDAGDAAEPDAPPMPKVVTTGWSWFKMGLGIFAGAALGAYASEKVRAYMRGAEEESDDETPAPAPAAGYPFGALPGAPQVMAIPMPYQMPFPSPYQMAPPAAPAPVPGYRDKRELSPQQELEKLRLESEIAKHRAQQRYMDAWADGDID